MSHHDYSLEELSDITPYENYITAIRDTVTKKKYAGQLEMFLNPDYDWEKSKSVYIVDPSGYEIELSEISGGGL